MHDLQSMLSVRDRFEGVDTRELGSSPPGRELSLTYDWYGADMHYRVFASDPFPPQT